MIEITVSRGHGRTVVTVAGPLIARQSADQLTEIVGWLCDAGERLVLLDAAGVTGIDIDGVVALLDGHARLRDLGGSLALRRPSPPLRLALRRTGLDAVLELQDGSRDGPREGIGRAS